MFINPTSNADAASLSKNQPTPAKAAAQTVANAADAIAASAATTTAAEAPDELMPTPEQLWASTDNLHDADEASQSADHARNSILSGHALHAQANLNPDTVFQLLLE